MRFFNGRVILRERLDHVAANLAFHEFLPAAKVINLPRLYGDHHPVLLDFCETSSQLLGQKPKRFLPPWLERDDFRPTFAAYWNQSGEGICKSIEDVVIGCQQWCKQNFGDIFKRKGTILRRLKGIQNSPSYNQSIFFIYTGA